MWMYTSSWQTHQQWLLQITELTRCFLLLMLEAGPGRQPTPSLTRAGRTCSGLGAEAASRIKSISTASWIFGCLWPRHRETPGGEHTRPWSGGARRGYGALRNYAAQLSLLRLLSLFKLPNRLRQAANMDLVTALTAVNGAQNIAHRKWSRCAPPTTPTEKRRPVHKEIQLPLTWQEGLERGQRCLQSK